LSKALFDPMNGLLTRAYPTQAQREAFLKTEQYQQIRELLNQAIEASGLVESSERHPRRAAVVRLPQSLHAALEREAKREGVSLNQLVVAKLAVQLSTLTSQGCPLPTDGRG
jgi:predicted HicB family RNase H-like nuclease